MPPNVTITPAAAKFINRIVRLSGMPAGAGLRLAVTPGGCSGYSSEFSPEPAPGPDEKALEVGDVRLFLGAESRLLLDGITIDFIETATQSGLSFIDPNKDACACSTATDGQGKPGSATIDISAISRKRPGPVIAR